MIQSVVSVLDHLETTTLSSIDGFVHLCFLPMFVTLVPSKEYKYWSYQKVGWMLILPVLNRYEMLSVEMCWV